VARRCRADQRIGAVRLRSVDKYGRRVTGQALRAVADYEAGHGTLLDLACAAKEAAAASDKASAPLPHLLRLVTSRLEAAHFASEAGSTPPLPSGRSSLS
jgi:hypothetical protein